MSSSPNKDNGNEDIAGEKLMDRTSFQNMDLPEPDLEKEDGEDA